jgi:hypothetical protein
MERVFCIGLNKTGTSSLQRALNKLGYKSVHAKTNDGINIKEKIENNFYQGKGIISGLENYTAFLDWDRDKTSHLIFKEFYKQYPDSKFILNTRELNGWLDSSEKHVLRNQKRMRDNPDKKISWLEINRKEWEKHYNEHHNSVYEYFSDKMDELLIYDITESLGWKPICEFLGHPVPKDPFPKMNIAPNLVRRLARKYRSIIFNKFK